MNLILMITYVLQLSATVLGKVLSDVAEPIDYPRYAFNYAISDSLSKDNKAQWEERDGGQVNGAYSLLEPDGNLRVVEYSADDLNGFSAIVKTLAASYGAALPADPVPFPIPPVNPLIDPLSYGFGVTPHLIRDSKVTLSGSSLPWDPKTRSFGGWVPITGRQRPITYATIYNKKYVNGKLYKIAQGPPIPLPSKSKILIKKKHIED